MPLDPNHIHAETPHAKTVHLASQGWRYGCHSSMTGNTKPRGGTGPEQIVPDGFAAIRKLIWDPVAEKEDRAIAITPLGVVVQSDWLPIPCGHTTRATDAACEGCANRAQTHCARTMFVYNSNQGSTAQRQTGASRIRG